VAGSGTAKLKKRSVAIAGHRTSVSLEEAFWRHLQRLAESRGVGVARLIADVDSTRDGNLSSALRVFVLRSVAGDAAEPRPVVRRRPSSGPERGSN
jgi:predicted DNA-binding ribbon-helix-helix protein